MAHARTYLLLGAALFCTSARAQTFTQTNLVSDGSTPAAFTDPNLVNPWGVSYAPSGAFWVSDADTGLTTLYNSTGAVQSLVVKIPAPPGSSGPSVPTGQVFNGTSDFQVTEAGKTGSAPFLFAAASGTISGWSPSVDAANAVIMVNNSANHAAYLGCALYSAGGVNNLLVANFATGKVEVYDGAYHLVTSFRDHGGQHIGRIPTTYSPHNVAVIAGHIFVTYAMVDPSNGREKFGNGLGYVDEVTIQGALVRRVAHHGVLNAPWGLAQAPSSFGKLAGALLVGNFGDGRISAYGFTSGRFLGQLQISKTSGNGQREGGKQYFSEPYLWSILPGNGAAAGDTSKLYFTAALQNEQHGLFGSLSP